MKAVALKLRRLREEYMEDCEPPSDIESCQAKVQRYLYSARPEAAPSAVTHISGTVSAESSRFWRKFTEEQANRLFTLTKDLIEANAIKKEVAWQKVEEEKRSLELKRLSGRENQEQEMKTKQRLTDKIRKMAREMKAKRKPYGY